MALTDQVIMPGSDYQAICDATRALTGKTGVLKSGDISTELGTIDIVEQATPSLTLNAATGVVTAEATQAAGLVAAGTKKATMQLATQAAKTVTPTEAEQTAVASGKYTTGNVVVAAVPTTYVGSGIGRKSSSDLTVDGATVNVPAGYYKNAASKSVATTTQATPNITVNSSGLITASATQSAGYVSAGTKSATKQLPTANAMNILNNVRVNLGYLSNTGKATLNVEFDSKSIGSSEASAGKFVEESYLVKNYTVDIPTETKTVELSMASGNQTVTNTEEKLMTAVTVVKPSTLVPSNIKKGVNIGGIVGTYGDDLFIREVSTINDTTSQGSITFTTSRLARYLCVRTRSGNSYVASADIRSISSWSSIGDLYLDITYKRSTYHYMWSLFRSDETNYDGANMTVYIIYDSL